MNDASAVAIHIDRDRNLSPISPRADTEGNLQHASQAESGTHEQKRSFLPRFASGEPGTGFQS